MNTNPEISTTQGGTEGGAATDANGWTSAQGQLAATLKYIAEANEASARQLVSIQRLFESWRQELAMKAVQLDRRTLIREETARPEAVLDDNRFPDSNGASESSDAEAADDGRWRRQLELAQEEVVRLRRELDGWIARLWPVALQGGAWANWRAELIRRTAAEPRLTVLMARLHTLAALESCGQVDLALLCELGRLLCRDCPGDVENVAAVLNASSRNQFELRPVRVGDRVDQRFMKPLSPGLTDVQQAVGWGVRDQHGTWQFPAEVR